MNKSEAGRVGKLGKKELEARIAALCAPFRPKVIRTYDEDGNEVKVFEAAYAGGYGRQNLIRPTTRQGAMSLETC